MRLSIWLCRQRSVLALTTPVCEARGLCWNVISKAWSHQITHVFITNNPEQVSQNTSLSLQIIGIHGLVQSFGSKTEALEAKVDSRLEDRAVIELLRDNIWLQSEHLELLKKG